MANADLTNSTTYLVATEMISPNYELVYTQVMYLISGVLISATNSLIFCAVAGYEVLN